MVIQYLSIFAFVEGEQPSRAYTILFMTIASLVSFRRAGDT